MARIGQISETARRVNDMRDEFASALLALGADVGDSERFLAALERFMNAKIEAALSGH